MARKTAMLALGAAGLALVGIGAGATFSDAVSGSQQIAAGKLDVQIVPGAGAVNGQISQDGKSITLPDLGPQGSTFTTQPQKFYFQNVGTIPASAIVLSASDTKGADAASQLLHDNLYVEVDGYNPTWAQGSSNPVVVFNGTLSQLESNPQAVAGTIAKNEIDALVVTFYAGQNGENPNKAANVGYGDDMDNSASLPQGAQGGVVTPTITVQYQG